MGIRFSKGFTIIETVLFLAISGMLIVGMVTGAGISLNIQRYRDATQSFKSLLQAQYSALSNVQNSRDNTWTCNGSAAVVAGGNVPVGQTNCYVVGKYLRIVGDDINIYTVLARPVAGKEVGYTSQPNDVAALKNDYALNAAQTEVEHRKMDWGTRIAWATSGQDILVSGASNPRTIGILIIRSPDTGMAYTFTSNSVPAAGINPSQSTFTPMLVGKAQVPGQAGRTLCIESNGLTFTGNTGVYLGAFTTTSSGVETRTNDIAGALSKC